MASKWVWRLGLSAFIFAALALLAWSVANQRGRIASRSQSVASRFALNVTEATLQREVKGYELAQLRQKAAEGSKIDVLQTKVQRSEIDLVFRQTRARYDAAWRGIAAITGIANLQPTPLNGDFSEAIQSMQWQEVSTNLVAASPEYAAAQARISQARAELDRHGVQAIPNVSVQLGAGVDNGTDSGMLNLQVGAPIPVFNKNQGNIAAARAEYCRATLEAQRIENAIRARLAIVSRDFDSAMEAITVCRDHS